MTKILAIFLFVSSYHLIHSQEKNLFRIEGGILITHFQQQIKQEVGDPRGERLINEFQLGFLLSGTYSITDWFSGGLFIRIDRGQRSAARFAGFNDEGKTITNNKVGGTYNEFWFGPLLQFNYKYFEAEIGYGLVGLRDDKGRSDIPSSTGDTKSSFSTIPTISWLFTVGGNFPVWNNFDLIIKLEYRNRYYNERGGNPLINNIEHGTQSISPIAGAAWKF